ncbi:MAG: class I SAM-dependent methyltransferase [bacterium]
MTSFHALMEERYPIMVTGIREAYAVDRTLVNHYFELTLGWMDRAFGRNALVRICDGYAFFTLEVNRAQVRYERTGRYEAKSFEECNRHIYQRRDYMVHYYWGVYAILFCWSHYVELMKFYVTHFVDGLDHGDLLEIAPGHGIWGLLAVHRHPCMRLEGLDISPTFLEFAPALAEAAGAADRCSYRCGDAMATERAGTFQHAVCCFMLEHLEDPGAFLRSLAGQLTKGGRAFVTLALTAAQPDHIYEFRTAEEAERMAEAAGFVVEQSRIFQPLRTLAGARFIPRVQGLILVRE